jgi:hypothetical protein
MKYDVRSYDYVNHPYDEVRRTLLADPIGVIRRATRVGSSDAGDAIAQLHVKLGSLDVAADVAMTITEVRDVVKYGRNATALLVTWQHPSHPGLFPLMNATVSIYPLSPTETQLELDGQYEPPLGLLGAAVDSMIGHRLAKVAIHGFVSEVATCLRGVAPRLDVATTAVTA